MIMGGSQDTSAGSSPVNVATPTENSSSLPELSAGIGGGDELIAIVGMGCRLPGDITSPVDLWDLMISKRIANSAKVPPHRFDINAYYHQNNQRPGSLAVSGGYFLNETCQDFDPSAFGISPVEALWMDPQQRKLLEVVYEAFESSGTALDQVSGSITGCYIGNFTSDYQQMIFKEPDFRHTYAATGIDPGIASNRISHVFDLRGPSVVLNTACSSQMYALHTACTAVLNRECDGAIVGGTNLILTIDQHLNTAKLGVLSPTNTCHAFDESADGYGRAEGVGALYIKRLDDAISNGDPVRAVIRSTAVNSNGRISDTGLTSPSVQGQVDVIVAAYRKANLDPALTSYVETHGTGTAIGDPVEARSVSIAMRGDGREHGPVLIGSVKPNIGHSEASSSIPTIIKSVLAVEKGIIPPTAGAVVPNPKIKWEEWRVKLVTEPTPFPSSTPIRRVGVNAFGYGGTNGHCIIENADFIGSRRQSYKSVHQEKALISAANGNFTSEDDDRPHLLVFSAHDYATLERNLTAFSNASHKFEANLLDLAYTLAVRRSKHRVRAYVLRRKRDAGFKFEHALQTTFQVDRPATVAFIFTGQGAQWPQMGATLIKMYPSFARTIQRLDFALSALTDPPAWTIEACLLEPAAESRVNDAEFSQTLCTAIQIGLVNLLRSWHIFPVATVGHSSGEIAAAYAAGFLSAKDAMVAAYYRGKSMCAVTAKGAMLAVGLSATQASSYLQAYHGRVVIGCHNSSKSTTISGDANAIGELKVTFDRSQIFARVLKTGCKAYHSPHMLEASRMYNQYMSSKSFGVAHISYQASKCQMISSVTCSLVDRSTIDSAYLIKNLTSPVLFDQAVQRMMTETPSIDFIIEIGPHSQLAAPIRQICIESNCLNVTYTPTLMRNEHDGEQLLKLAGLLWAKDSQIDMKSVTKFERFSDEETIVADYGSLLVDLPTYQWNYSKKNWLEPRQSHDHRSQSYPRHDVLGRRIPGCSPTEPSWQNVLRHKDLPWLKHHTLGGDSIFPAAGYFAMAFEALVQTISGSPEPTPISSLTLTRFTIQAALVIPDDSNGVATVLSMRLSDPALAGTNPPFNHQAYFFTISTYSNGSWKVHATGCVQANLRMKGQERVPLPVLSRHTSGRLWYQRLRDVGFDYGTTFRGMDDIASDGKSYEATSNSSLSQACGLMEGESQYFLHPGSFDSCSQLIMVAIHAGRVNDVSCGVTPVFIGEVTLWPPSAQDLERGQARSHAWVAKRGHRTFLANSQLIDANGGLILDIADMQCTSYEAAIPPQSINHQRQYPYMQTEWKADVDHLRYLKPCAEAGDLQQPTVDYLLDLLLHKNAELRVLDLDARISLATIASRTWTDFTVAAKSKNALQSLQDGHKQYDNVKIVQVDIEQDLPQLQTDTKYDMVLAAKVSDVKSLSLENIHRLLAPGGRLFLAETTASEDSWRTALESSGFSGVDFVYQNVQTGFSHILSTVSAADEKGIVQSRTNSHVVLVYRDVPTAVHSSLVEQYAKCNWNVRSSSLEKLVHQTGEHVIMLADLEGPLLATLKESELSSLRRLMDSATSILWVTCGGLISGEKAEFAMTVGFARSLASEKLSLDLTTIDFSLDSCADVNTARVICDIAKDQSTRKATRESEYLVDKGIVHINRLVPDQIINEKFAFGKGNIELVSLKDCEPLRGVLEREKVFFCKDERTDQPLDRDHVEIKAMAVGLNKEDKLVVTGSDHLTTFSHEAAGAITAVGSNVSQFKVGDRVVGFFYDTCATYQRTLAELVQPIADGNPYVEMATIPMSFATALYGLQELARVQGGEFVLVLGGGASALAAAQICKAADAKVLAITGDDDDLTTLQRNGLLPEEVVFATRQDICTEVLRRNAGRGADVVFGSEGTASYIFDECCRRLAPFSRIITFGRRDPSRPLLEIRSNAPGFCRFSFDILDLYTEKPELLAKLLKQSLELYNDRRISAIQPIRVWSVSETQEAIHSYSDRLSDGKAVIYYGPDSQMKVLPIRSPLLFRSDATYLLVGCLGGLGRSLTSWMADRGAKHFALMSRSGAHSPSAARTVASIRSLGADVTILRCDVSSRTEIELALESLDDRYPIRGIVNAAVVFDDGLFHNMTIDRWNTPFRAKVQGSLNLHEIFQSHKLDFFVMTSSVSGIIGNPGQSNYAAANTFLDALGRHRRTQGLPAVSLILPMVLGIGYVAEHSEIEDLLQGRGLYGIDEAELLAAFEVSMASQADLHNPIDHVIVGLEPAELAKSLSQTSLTHVSWLDNPRFRTTAAIMKAYGTRIVETPNTCILTAIGTAKSAEDAITAVTACLALQLSKVLLIDQNEFLLTQSRTIASYGIDSLIGADFRNWIFREFEVDVPFQQLLGPELTVTKLAAKLCAAHGKGV